MIPPSGRLRRLVAARPPGQDRRSHLVLGPAGVPWSNHSSKSSSKRFFSTSAIDSVAVRARRSSDLAEAWGCGRACGRATARFPVLNALRRARGRRCGRTPRPRRQAAPAPPAAARTRAGRRGDAGRAASMAPSKTSLGACDSREPCRSWRDRRSGREQRWHALSHHLARESTPPTRSPAVSKVSATSPGPHPRRARGSPAGKAANATRRGQGGRVGLHGRALELRRLPVEGLLQLVVASIHAQLRARRAGARPHVSGGAQQAAARIAALRFRRVPLQPPSSWSAGAAVRSRGHPRHKGAERLRVEGLLDGRAGGGLQQASARGVNAPPVMKTRRAASSGRPRLSRSKNAMPSISGMCRSQRMTSHDSPALSAGALPGRRRTPSRRGRARGCA